MFLSHPPVSHIKANSYSFLIRFLAIASSAFASDFRRIARASVVSVKAVTGPASEGGKDGNSSGRLSLIISSTERNTAGGTRSTSSTTSLVSDFYLDNRNDEMTN